MAAERVISSVTRPAVLSAMAEYDAIGQKAFLAKYGFGAARTYRVWHDGKAYDSKAIVGAAFGYLPNNPAPLRFDEFSGGVIYVVPVLEKLGFSFTNPGQAPKRNPAWSRDELVLALDLYRKHEGRDPGDSHPDVIEVSVLLREMANEAGLSTFRNGNGVAMKLMNFRSLDPAFTSKGNKGLASASKLDRIVWDEFAGRPLELAIAAASIRDKTVERADDDVLDELTSYVAKEGRVSYRLHRTLERDRKLVAIRKEAALKKHGKLDCEACGFDFNAAYGVRGLGFIECHHTNPVHAMKKGDVTTLDDLALLCSNCHRMVHAAKPWLSLDQLRSIVEGASADV